MSEGYDGGWEKGESMPKGRWARGTMEKGEKGKRYTVRLYLSMISHRAVAPTGRPTLLISAIRYMKFPTYVI